MNHTETQEHPYAAPRETHETQGIVAGGSLAVTIAGAGAIVLAIIGLSGILPDRLASVAAIVLGGGFILSASSIAARFSSLMSLASEGTVETSEMGMGMTSEFIGGVGAVALGVLSLVGIIPNTLLPVAAIVFGATLLFGLGVQARLNDLEMQANRTHAMARRVAKDAVYAASGVQALLGLGAIALGILGLIGIATLVLMLVAMLSIGAATLLSGSALSARMWTYFEAGAPSRAHYEAPHHEVP